MTLGCRKLSLLSVLPVRSLLSVLPVVHFSLSTYSLFSSFIKQLLRLLVSSSFASLHNTSFSSFWRRPPPFAFPGRPFFIPLSFSIVNTLPCPLWNTSLEGTSSLVPSSYRPSRWDRPAPYVRHLPPFIGQGLASCLFRLCDACGQENSIDAEEILTTLTLYITIRYLNRAIVTDKVFDASLTTLSTFVVYLQFTNSLGSIHFVLNQPTGVKHRRWLPKSSCVGVHVILIVYNDDLRGCFEMVLTVIPACWLTKQMRKSGWNRIVSISSPAGFCVSTSMTVWLAHSVINCATSLTSSWTARWIHDPAGCTPTYSGTTKRINCRVLPLQQVTIVYDYIRVLQGEVSRYTLTMNCNDVPESAFSGNEVSKSSILSAITQGNVVFAV